MNVQRPVHPVSAAFRLIWNLYATAWEHSNDCSRPDCGVSLFMLKEAAQRLAFSSFTSEQDTVAAILADWPL